MMKPLPEHTIIDYEECYAKLLLEDLFPEELINLEIKDKPDLQNQNVGIEVTNARDEGQLMAENMYSNLLNDHVRDKKRTKELIEKEHKCKVTDWCLIGKTQNDSINLILKSFYTKLKKLNQGGYNMHESNRLFILSDIYADEKMLKEVLCEMIQAQAVNEKIFQKVYINVPRFLYVFDLEKDTYNVKEISSDTQFRLANEARDFVLAHEI